MSTQQVPASEFFPEFVQGMKDRMSMSYFKYGPVRKAYPDRFDAVEDLKKRLEKYELTGNTEWLMDVANFCLGPESRIWMRDLTWRRLGDIEVGDEIVGFTEEPVTRKTQRSWAAAKVLTKQQIKLPCCRVTLSSGRDIITSTDHRWLAASPQGGGGWYYHWLATGRDGRTGMRQGGLHYLPQIAPIVLPLEDYDSGWLAGFMDGEGHANQSGGRSGCLKVVWGQNPGLAHTRAVDLLDSRGYDVAQCTTRKCICASIRGGIWESWRLLMELRPVRLLADLNPDCWGAVRQHGVDLVTGVTEIGVSDVIAIGTTTGTFVAEGYGQHNCMIEFALPRHPKAHFRSTDSHESPGRFAFDPTAAPDARNDEVKALTELIED